jgi:formate hydrogenlyase subunit 6/NADH:ubiquinone oxidoreductase subunit I
MMKTLFGMPLGGRSLKNLLARPATRRYPTTVRAPFPGSRGHIVIDLSGCTFCGNCVKRCAPAALSMDRDQRTLTLEHLRCIACGVCAEVCTPHSLTMVTGALGALAAEKAGPEGSSPRGLQTERQAAPPEPATPDPTAAR